MHARLVLVPLDLRMSADADRDDRPRVRRPAPDPGHRPGRARPTRVRPRRLPDDDRRGPLRRAGGRRSRVPATDWEPRQAAWVKPDRRRGLRADLHERHDRHAEGRDAHPRQRRRLDRVVPPDRPADGPPDRVAAAASAICWSSRSGSTTRSTSGRTSSTSAAGTRGSSSIRCASTGSRAWSSSRRCSTSSGAPSSARSTSAAAAPAFERLRGIARRLPFAMRRVLFRSIHAQLGGSFRLFVSSGAFLPPALQQAWEDLGVVVLQGYGATETGHGHRDHAQRPRPRHRRLGTGRHRAAHRRRRRDPVPRADRLLRLLACARVDR